jgi:hypothetical protein
MENRSYTNETSTYETPVAAQAQSDQNNRILIGVVVAVIILLGLLGTGVYFLLQPTTDTARIRDIFIIFMALESLLIGLALVILLIQLARLINLLQNEIKPIIESTNETVSSLRGTTTFLSDNLVEPVIKLNQYLAAITQTFKIIGLTRKKNNKN